MAKALFIINPMKGHMAPALYLAKALIKYGEELVFYTNKENYEAVSSINAQFRHAWFWEKKYISHDVSLVMQNKRSMAEFEFVVSRYLSSQHSIAEVLINEIDTKNLDYIVYDTTLYFPSLITEKVGIPAFTLSTTPIYIEDMFDLDPAFVITKVFKLNEKYIDNANGTKNAIREIANKFARKESKFIDYEYIVNNFFSYGKYNFNFSSTMLQMFSTAIPMDRFGFFGLYALSKNNNLNERKTIYISLGTSEVNKNYKFYQMCINVLSNMDYNVIISIGYENDISSFRNIGENISLVSFTNQINVLGISCLYICHGGFAGIREAVALKVPIIVCPFAFDQYWCARSIEETGIGIAIEVNDINELELKKVVLEILENPFYKENIIRLSNEMKGLGGVDKMAETVILKFNETRELH
jgi:MGT family glycosyltransferase